MKPPTPSPSTPIAVPSPKRDQSATLEEIDEDEAEELKQRKEFYEAEERRKEKERKRMNEAIYDEKVRTQFAFESSGSEADDEKVWALD